MQMAAIILTGLVALGGCAAERARVEAPASAPSRAEAQATLRRQIGVCRARYPAGSHFLDKARCDEAARREVILAAGTPPDLAETYLAARAEVAARLDRGEITREQADLALAKAGAETNGQAQARRRAATPGVVASVLRPDAPHLPPPVPIPPGARW
jgi:hypothetical protein